MKKKFVKFATAILGIGTITTSTSFLMSSCSDQKQAYQIEYSASNKLNFINNQLSLKVKSKDLEINSIY